MRGKSVADIMGPWLETNWQSGLIERCREYWNVPIAELSNEVLATFLRQDIAMDCVLEEAVRRLNAGFDDDSELFEGELAESVQYAQDRRARQI